MGSRAHLVVVVSILTVSLPSLVGVHLSKSEVERAVNSVNVKLEHRFKRQLLMNPQPFNPIINNRVLQVPIPVNIGFFPGGAPQPIDQCDRDEIMTEDGTCQRILSRGNCQNEQEVILDPQTNQGFCAPRICPPDRVFIPTTQLCHDPRDTSVCPPGRELYYSAFGTPVCTCPDGTVEGDDDLDDDVCEVLLSKSLQCPYGQDDNESTSEEYDLKDINLINENVTKVFWFKDFNSPPGCFPDPCNGANLKRGPNELPFVPDMYGKCFQLGTSAPACPQGKLYVLDLQGVVGECSSLEDAGYNIYDPEVLDFLKKMYGPTITLNNAPPIQLKKGSNVTSTVIVTGTYVTGAVDPQGNAIDSTINQGTRRPGTGSNYQSYSNQIGQMTTPIVLQSSLGQNKNKISTSNTISSIQGNRPSTPTHHVVFIGPNGITTTKNQLGSSQQSFGQRPTSSHNIQQSFSQQTQKPNKQNTQIFVPQQNTPKPFIQQTIPKPTIQQSSQNNNNFPNIINSVSNNNIQTSNQNAQQGQGKKVCTFVQAAGTAGKKVCTFVTSNGQLNSNEINGQGGQQVSSFELFRRRSYGYRLGKSFGFRNDPEPGLLTHHVTVYPSGHVITHLRPASRTKRDLSPTPKRSSPKRSKRAPRRKRNVLPHASPSNVFETRLLGCRSGAARDINGKCRSKVLPTRIPKSRGTRAAPPVPPTPSCPNGMAFNIRRRCVPATTAQNSLLAFNLG